VAAVTGWVASGEAELNQSSTSGGSDSRGSSSI